MTNLKDFVSKLRGNIEKRAHNDADLLMFDAAVNDTLLDLVSGIEPEPKKRSYTRKKKGDDKKGANDGQSS